MLNILAALAAADLQGLFVELSTEAAWNVDLTGDSAIAVPLEAHSIRLVPMLQVATEFLTIDSFFLAEPVVVPAGGRSPFFVVPTESRLELRVSSGTLSTTLYLLRAPLYSTLEAAYPDPATLFIARQSLTGLQVIDSEGKEPNMEDFQPRKSRYVAGVYSGASMVRVVASKNDPDARLEYRVTGGQWFPLESGVPSTNVGVPLYGWTMVDVRVENVLSEESLIYSIVVTKGLVCHRSCPTCTGPGEQQCTTCRAPLLLHQGRCLYTQCTGQHYFDWDAEECRPCDASCKECEGPLAEQCSACEELRFLVVATPMDKVARCDPVCPLGYYVDPESTRCTRPLPGERLPELFYVQLALRITIEEFAEDPRLPSRLVLATASMLKISPAEARFHNRIVVEESQMVVVNVEVGPTPFLSVETAQGVKVDRLFAAAPVPVDTFEILTQEQLYPPPEPPIEPPLLPSWAWAMIGGFFAWVIVITPAYYLYFRRKYYSKTRYIVKKKHQLLFVHKVVADAPNSVIRMVAKSTD
mmetsp:Transcript_81343/g.186066  ORF Transcript_81343/g.186066 Transcript_81343/m.186066 type:complete len:527 (+) Transcript_81343:56-1636(+)